MFPCGGYLLNAWCAARTDIHPDGGGATPMPRFVPRLLLWHHTGKPPGEPFGSEPDTKDSDHACTRLFGTLYPARQAKPACTVFSEGLCGAVASRGTGSCVAFTANSVTTALDKHGCVQYGSPHNKRHADSAATRPLAVVAAGDAPASISSAAKGAHTTQRQATHSNQSKRGQ